MVLGYDDSPSANAALGEVIRRAPLLGADICVVFKLVQRSRVPLLVVPTREG